MSVGTGLHTSPEQTVTRVLEPGEKIIWTGRPDVELMTGHLRGGAGIRLRGRGILATLALVGATGYLFMDGQFGFEAPGSMAELRDFILDGPGGPLLAVAGLLGFALFARAKGWDNTGAYVRWAENQTYAITDRRLLILDGENIAWQFGPEDFGEPRIRERGQHHADIEFREVRLEGRRGTALNRDRTRIGFKALKNAGEVRRRIEEWRRAHREQEESEVESFLDAPARPGTGGGTDSIRTIRNEEFGVTVHVPEAWDIEVRRRRKPYGRIFLDRENWKSPETLPDWNVLRARGDFHSAFEIHLDRVKKLVTPYEKALNSSLVNAVAGKVVDSDGGVRRGRFEGYRITRDHVVHGRDQDHKDINRPALVRQVMLHDGRLQVGIVMLWPKDSEPLRLTVEKILDTLEID